MNLTLKLQLVENAVLHLLTGMPMWGHIQPVEYWVRLKVLVLGSKALYDQGPTSKRPSFPKDTGW